MDAKELAKNYAERFGSYKEAREKALVNIVNSPFSFGLRGRISNQFIEEFWEELNKHFKS